MKVQDILQAPTQTNDKNIEESLKKFNWRYEFSDDLSEIQKGTQKLALIENQIYNIWKKNPDKAIDLWNKYCPWSQKSGTPIFLLRLEAQEKK